MNIESEEEKDLVCEYFNPTSKLTIYSYRIMARALLNAYLAQVKKYSIYGEQLEPAYAYTLIELLDIIRRYCYKKWDLEYREKVKEYMEFIKNLKISKDDKSIYNILPALSSINSVIIEELKTSILEEILDIALKSASLVVLYLKQYFSLRTANKMLQEYVHYLERNIKDLERALSQDPTKLYHEIAKAFRNTKVGLEKFSLDDEYVEKFAKKLKEIREKVIIGK